MWYLRRIPTRQNDRRFRREIGIKLFCHETIFNCNINSFEADFFIIKNKVIIF